VVKRGVRGHRQERGPARDLGRRGSDQAAVRQLHRQRQGLHAEREGQEPVHGRDEEPDERLMRSIEEKIDIPETRKDDFRREIMNYIGALARRGPHVRLQDQRAAAPRARAEAVRGPEGHDQADQPRLDVVDKDTQEKIDVVKQPPDPRLRLRRDQRDRRAELRRVDLRARRHQGRVSPSVPPILCRAR
jgi:hypothetical protein